MLLCTRRPGVYVPLLRRGLQPGHSAKKLPDLPLVLYSSISLDHGHHYDEAHLRSVHVNLQQNLDELSLPLLTHTLLTLSLSNSKRSCPTLSGRWWYKKADPLLQPKSFSERLCRLRRNDLASQSTKRLGRRRIAQGVNQDVQRIEIVSSLIIQLLA